MTCIIIEDEPLAVEILSDYISRVPSLNLEGTFKNALLARAFMERHNVDVMFLDIHLPRLKGMDFLKSLSNPPAVIITTAYHQYAVEGFDLNVVDYLLKPFDFQRFLKAIRKVRPAREEHDESVKGDRAKDHIFVSVHKKRIKILLSEITYVESQREYVKIATTKSDYVSKMSTREVEGLLPSHLFKRIHRSFIISLNRIESYTPRKVEINGVSIPIGRRYRNIVKSLC
jgi:DNA-binding LytR/AlgR family response regulator